MLQFLIVVLLVAESVYSAKAMGIGRFARTFPCSEKYCPLSAKRTGCTKTPILKHTQVDRIPTTSQSTTGHSNYEQFSSKQDILEASTTNHAVQSSEAVLQISINYTTTGLESDNRATTGHPISTTRPSPPKKVSTNETIEQGSTKASILNHTQAKRNPPANHSTSGHLTHKPAIYQVIQSSEAALQTSVNYTTNKKGRHIRSTTESPIFATTSYPSSGFYHNSMNGQGSTTSMPTFNNTDRTSTTNLSTTDPSTHEPFSSKQHMLNTLNTNQVVQTYEPVLRISTTYATTKQGSDNRVTTRHTISTTPPCPPNMVYACCTEGQGSCQNPSGGTVTCSESMICVCPVGFLMRDNDCVPQEECECFIAGVGVLQDGETNVNADCTNRCECQSNVLTCDEHYRCSSAATCEERDGVRQCYCNDGFKGNGQNCELDATDCADVYNAGFRQSGVYTIKPTNWPGSPFEAYCNMAHGGGWTVS